MMREGEKQGACACPAGGSARGLENEERGRARASATTALQPLSSFSFPPTHTTHARPRPPFHHARPHAGGDLYLWPVPAGRTRGVALAGPAACAPGSRPAAATARIDRVPGSGECWEETSRTACTLLLHREPVLSLSD